MKKIKSRTKNTENVMFDEVEMFFMYYPQSGGELRNTLSFTNLILSGALSPSGDTDYRTLYELEMLPNIFP